MIKINIFTQGKSRRCLNKKLVIFVKKARTEEKEVDQKCRVVTNKE